VGLMVGATLGFTVGWSAEGAILGTTEGDVLGFSV